MFKEGLNTEGKRPSEDFRKILKEIFISKYYVDKYLRLLFRASRLIELAMSSNQKLDL